MMKKKNYLFVLLLSLFLVLTGCGPGMADFDFELGNGYEVWRINPQEVMVVERMDESTASHVIPPKVVEIAWNDQYVIAKQFVLVEPKPGESGIAQPDENQVNYWILNKVEGQLDGPLDLTRFNEKLIEFSLTELQLKPVVDYQ